MKSSNSIVASNELMINALMIEEDFARSINSKLTIKHRLEPLKLRNGFKGSSRIKNTATVEMTLKAIKIICMKAIEYGNCSSHRRKLGPISTFLVIKNEFISLGLGQTGGRQGETQARRSLVPVEERRAGIRIRCKCFSFLFFACN